MIIVDWWRNRKRKKRLFTTEENYQRHVKHLSMQNRSLYISYANSIKRFIIKGNTQEVENRRRWLKDANLTPPNTVEECEQMISDLREYYV